MNNSFYKTLGPGILFASTAIGVSHLVQSTRAGAEYGFALILFVVLANIFKYPFFEFGSRYANVTGTSLLEGYKKLGNWVLYLYFLITLFSMFIIVAAVAYVCAGLLSELFSFQNKMDYLVLLLFATCILILTIGKYSLLDGLVKTVGFVLLCSTILAFIFAIINGAPEKTDSFVSPSLYSRESILFIIALMGWMPTAVDMSVWNSIWTIERIKQTSYHPNLKETLLDFNIGYIITLILAICFLSLGSLLVFGTAQSMPDSSSLFAKKLIKLYTNSLGDWSYWIIVISAFSVMFSTTIAVFDGYCRSIQRTTSLLFNINTSHATYVFWLFIISIFSYLIITKYTTSFKSLIDLATTISFLIAPFCAVINHLVVHSKEIPIKLRPPVWLRYLSYSGIVFLLFFSIIFMLIK